MKYFIPLFLLILLVGCASSDKTEDVEGSNMTDDTKLPVISSLWDYNNPAETEKRFRELTEQPDVIANVDYHAQLMTQIARALGLQQKFEEAHKVLDETKSMLTDDTKTAKIRYFLERGRVFNSSGNKEEAKKLFMEAYEYGKENKLDYFTFDAVHMLGIAGTSEEQIKWNLIALELCEKTDDENLKQWQGPVYNNLGWAYHDMKNFEKANEYFEIALKWWEEHQHPMGIFFAKWTVARGYRSLKKIDEAIEIQHALEKEMAAEDGIKYGYVFDELGELYLLKHEDEKAYKYFKLAYDMLIETKEDGWLQQNKPEQWKRIKDFAEKAK